MEFFSQTLINSFEIFFLSIYFSFLGASFYNFIYRKKIKINNFLTLNIIGLFILYIFISIWNIFLPINKYAFFVTLIPIALFLLKFRKELFFIKLNSILNRNSFILISFTIITLMWIANICIAPLVYEPMYHIQKIRWAQQYPLVPGLANLFDHYGFDSSMFYFVAFFNNIFKYSMWNFSGYLLFTCIIYSLLIPIQLVFFNQRTINGSYIMRILFTPIIIHYCFYFAPGTNTDLFSSFFGLLVAVNIYKVFIERKNDYIQIFFLLILGFSAKITFLPILVLSIIVLLFFKTNFLLDFFLKQKIITLIIIFGFSIQLHKNIILTGYLFYPKNLISIPVQWKVPEDNLQNLNNTLKEWPVGSPETNKNYNNDIKDWLKTRFLTQHRKVETLYPLIIGVLGLFFITQKKRRIHFKNLAAFSIPAIGQILFFFFIIPDGRFASFAFWWLGAGLFSLLIKQSLFNKRKYSIAFITLVIVLSFSIHTFDRLGRVSPLLKTEISKRSLVSPSYNIFITNSGLKLNVPKQNMDCHDCPLPCTISPSYNLRLIDGASIAKGFYIDQ